MRMLNIRYIIYIIFTIWIIHFDVIQLIYYDDIIGDDVLFKQGVVDGKQAYVNGNYSIYSEAIKYCELVVKPGKQKVLKDPGFKYNIGIVHGYEEQFE